MFSFVKEGLLQKYEANISEQKFRMNYAGDCGEETKHVKIGHVKID